MLLGASLVAILVPGPASPTHGHRVSAAAAAPVDLGARRASARAASRIVVVTSPATSGGTSDPSGTAATSAAGPRVERTVRAGTARTTVAAARDVTTVRARPAGARGRQVSGATIAHVPHRPTSVGATAARRPTAVVSDRVRTAVTPDPHAATTARRASGVGGRVVTVATTVVAASAATTSVPQVGVSSATTPPDGIRVVRGGTTGRRAVATARVARAAPAAGAMHPASSDGRHHARPSR